MTKGGLGRGLGALIPQRINKVREILGEDSPAVANVGGILQIPTNRIKANPLQPRMNFSYEDSEDLINSIKKHGIIQPLIVTKKDDSYQLIAGERRLRSAQILELPTVPAIVREASEQHQLELALIENIQRKDLNPIEQAYAFQRLIDEFNLTQEQAAERVGKSRSVVANILRLLTLPEEIQKAVIDEKINFSSARLIAGLPVNEQLKFFKKLLKSDLSVRAAEGEAKKIVVRQHVRKTKDPNLISKEEELRNALGTKVAIKKSGNTGQIVIDFYSDEELQELISKITAK